MTRFIYIADTHLGAEPMGYRQQKAYPEKLSEIVDALNGWLATSAEVDFILHGGDMIDEATDANLQAAASLFDLCVPVYLCLGNHDLTGCHARAQWLERAPAFFPGGSPEYTIETTSCLIHVVPNHWCAKPYCWEGEQNPHLSSAQHDFLSTALKRESSLPNLLLTHSPVFGLPTQQTGFTDPFHAPPQPFTRELADLAATHHHLHCVLGAHNHMNMRLDHAGTEFITVSSLVETPFEFKLFEITPQTITMETLSLRPKLTFQAEYDSSKSFVQGRPGDRRLTRTTPD